MSERGERGTRGSAFKSNHNRRGGRGGGNSWWSSGKKSHVQQLESGARGFFCTCNNFQEKNCIREAYNLLNEFAPPDPSEVPPTETVEPESEDPSEMLQSYIGAMKQRENKPRRFNSLVTNVNNCIFIQGNVEDPVSLGYTIVKHIAETKLQKTRFLLRMIPIEVTCGVTITTILEAAGKLFDKYFLGEPTTFCIVFNRRYNNSVSRDTIIKEFADMVTAKNSEHKVDLTNPKLTVIVEVLKGVCMMSVLQDYNKFKKYNIVELCSPEKDKPDNTTPDIPKETQPSNEAETPEDV